MGLLAAFVIADSAHATTQLLGGWHSANGDTPDIVASGADVQLTRVNITGRNDAQSTDGTYGLLAGAPASPNRAYDAKTVIEGGAASFTITITNTAPTVLSVTAVHFDRGRFGNGPRDVELWVDAAPGVGSPALVYRLDASLNNDLTTAKVDDYDDFEWTLDAQGVTPSADPSAALTFNAVGAIDLLMNESVTLSLRFSDTFNPDTAAFIDNLAVLGVRDGAFARFDLSNVITTVPHIGGNTQWYSLDELWLNPTTGAFTPSAIAALERTGMSIRHPGGTVTNLYDWERAIGPMDQRELQANAIQSAGATFDSDFGPLEAALAVEISGGSLLPVINFNLGAESAANLVEYLNAEVGANPNGGIDYAALRADHGHPEPFGVVDWEIHNEAGGREQEIWANWPSSGDDNINNGIVQGSEQAKDWWVLGGSRVFTDQQAVRRTSWREPTIVSNGAPNEEFYTKYPPVSSVAQVRVGPDLASAVPWPELTMADFTDGAGGSAPGYVIDLQSGRIQFGDGVSSAVLPAGWRVYVDYTSGPHDGYIEFYTQMKAVDPSIRIHSGHFAIRSRYAQVVAGGADINGEQDHGGGGIKLDALLPGVSFFDVMIGRGYFTFGQAMSGTATAMSNSGLPPGTEIMNSEYSYWGKLFDSSIGLNWKLTVGSAVMLGLILETVIMDFGHHTTYPVNTHLMNYVYSAAGAPQHTELLEPGGLQAGTGYVVQMFNTMFGQNVLEREVLSTATRTVHHRFEGDIDTTPLRSGEVPQVVMLASTRDDGAVTVVAINTTEDEPAVVTAEFVGGADFCGGSVDVQAVVADSLTAINTFTTPFAIRIVDTTNPATDQLIDDQTVRFAVGPASVAMATILPRSTSLCTVDVNTDGEVGAFDAALFLGLVSAGDPRGDYNRDGSTDSGDIELFLIDLELGQ